MSVPLDRLYNFLQTVCNQDIIIYRFFPHGSKKWDDCLYVFVPDLRQQLNAVPVICHDQEPFSLINIPKPINAKFTVREVTYQPNNPVSWFKIRAAAPHFPYSKAILVHSELNSKEIDMLADYKAVGAYYWSHALIARDWFRYAEHDPAIKKINTQVPFLIYNRAWSGTREYRLKFVELVINQGLQQYCNLKFAVEDEGKPYTKHKFANLAFATDCKFEKFLLPNDTKSSASADYDSNDYNNTDIEIVLETLFDETKWHLTEKTLRPIAVGKPFVLAATPGSLKYLQRYGFKTFAPWIDESYDEIEDPVQRLAAIVKIIKDFVSLDTDTKNKRLAECQLIADYNKKLFFSDEFFQHVVNEYTTNINAAVNTVKQETDVECFEQWLAQQPADIVEKAMEYFPLALSSQ